MSKVMTRELVAEQAFVHQKLPAKKRVDVLPDVLPKIERAPHVVDRTFELPKRFYAITVGLFLGFLAVMVAGMPTPGLVVPIAICAIIVSAFFFVPSLWVGMKHHENVSQSLRWEAFKREGIQTYTGRIAARDASVQVLILPVLIFAWGVAIVTIKAIAS